MMRANMQGMSGIKGMMLKHGEKIGLAVIGLAVVWFIYSSIGRDSLPPEKPAELEGLVTSASNHIEKETWETLPKKEKDTAEEAKPSRKPMERISPKVYGKLGKFDSEILPPRKPRHDPTLLAVVDLEVLSGAGIMPHLDKAEQERRAREEEIEDERRRREDAAARDDGAEGGNRGPGGGERGGPRGGGEGGRGVGMGGGRGMGGGLFGGGGGARGSGGVAGDDPDVRMIEMANQMGGFIPEGTERLDLTYWNCVVGKVPIKKQIKEFSKALQKSYHYDASTDYPRYIVYIVERKEITESGESEWQRVKPRAPEKRNVVPYINDKYLAQLTWDWPMQMEPVVGQQFIDPLLTYPLPPIVGHQWGKDATHSDIPLFDPNDLPEDAEDETSLEDDGEPVGEDDFAGGFRGDDMGGMRGGEMGGMRGGARPGGLAGGRGNARPGGIAGGRGGMMGGGSRGGMMGGRSGGGELGGRGGSRGMGGRGIGGMGGIGGRGMGGGRGGEMGGGYGTVEEAEYLLFRFFDFDVRPGKKYSYRIRLVLDDPNHNKSKRDLAPEVRERRDQLDPKKRAYRLTDWSEPSPVVGVPLPGKVLAGEIKPASSKSHMSEPSAKLVLRAFAARTAEELISEQDRCYRGKVGNIKVSKGWVIAANRRELHRKEDFLVRTGVMLADMSGGGKLDGNRDMTAPGEVLLMSPTGRLYVHGELKDADDVRFYHDLLTEDKDRNRGGEMGGRGEGGMFGPPGRGGGRGGGR